MFLHATAAVYTKETPAGTRKVQCMHGACARHSCIDSSPSLFSCVEKRFEG